MLILSRRQSERICLGDNIVLTIVHVSGDKVRIGVEAPSNVKILRTELERYDNASVPTEAHRGATLSIYREDAAPLQITATNSTAIVNVERRAA